jgi:Asp-tRNA(Asn)/Glu-tRNA(Gln) amidotransferase A subunit family amidase
VFKVNKEEICFMSACEMAEKIKTQELTSLEITETIIERIEKVNPIINAYCTTSFDLAREMAEKADMAVKKRLKLGILNGIPTSIKDLIETKGVRTTYGSKIYENYIPNEDDLTVKKLKDAGIVLLGKTNTPEDGHKAITDNLIFGESKNPWNIKKTCGGSSGGAAAAVSAGLGPLALGSDGGGSVRIPSCFCGVYGLKPNFGRIARNFTHIAFSDLSHYGPIVRYVKDAALMLDVMAGPDPIDKHSIPLQNTNFLKNLKEKPKRLKIGYSMDLGFVKAIDDDVEKAVFTAAQKFEKFDWKVEEAKLKFKNAYNTFTIIVTAALAYDYKLLMNKWRDKLTPTLVKMIDAGMSYKSLDLIQAESQRKEIERSITDFFKRYDIMITPTTTIPAFELGIMFPERIAGKTVSPTGWMPFAFPFNMSWNPAASIPCGWSKEGLPIGMQIIGRLLDETTVLQVSKAFEDICPWQDKKPQFN